MCSSGTAARRRTAHLMVPAREGNSTTRGPASHSTIVNPPIGELYDVHSTRMGAPIFPPNLAIPQGYRRMYIERPLRPNCCTSTGWNTMLLFVTFAVLQQ